MKVLRKISLIIAAVSMVLVVGGCGEKTEEQSMNNFNVTYEAEKTVDKVIYKLGDFEAELNPMHEDKKVKKGYKSHVSMDEIELNLSLEIIDNEEIIYKVEDTKIDLTNGKKAEVKIVDGKDGAIEVEITNN